MNVFSERLKEAMNNTGMTQTRLSATVGLCKSSVSQYLSGKTVPGKANMKRIAEALGVSPDWLSGRADEMRAETGATLRPEDAAKLLGVGVQCVRVGLQNGSLPFGSAVKMPSGKYRYVIPSKRFAEYMGSEV